MSSTLGKIAVVLGISSVPFAGLYWIMQIVQPDETEFKRKMQEHLTPQEIDKINNNNEKKIKQFREALGLDKIQEELKASKS